MKKETVFKVYEDGKLIGYEFLINGNWASALAPEFQVRSGVISSFSSNNVERSRSTGIVNDNGVELFCGDVFYKYSLFEGKRFRIDFKSHVAMVVFETGARKHLFEVESYLKELDPIGNFYEYESENI